MWKYLAEPAAHEVRVGIMGLGVLGSAAARALAVFGYQLRGWSRSPKVLEGVTCYAGPEQLDAFLADTDILAVLLPLTPDTRGLIGRRLLAKLSRAGRDERLPGAVLINAGRGGLQVDGEILESLRAGEIYAASLDVFETEPLPHSSPLWSHPRVVTLHHHRHYRWPSPRRARLVQLRVQAEHDQDDHVVAGATAGDGDIGGGAHGEMDRAAALDRHADLLARRRHDLARSPASSPRSTWRAARTRRAASSLVQLDIAVEHADLASAKATLQEAEVAFQRQADLIAKRVTSEANLDTARAKRDTAMAAVKRSRR